MVDERLLFIKKEDVYPELHETRLMSLPGVDMFSKIIINTPEILLVTESRIPYLLLKRVRGSLRIS